MEVREAINRVLSALDRDSANEVLAGVFESHEFSTSERAEIKDYTMLKRYGMGTEGIADWLYSRLKQEDQ